MSQTSIDPKEFSELFLTNGNLENVVCHMCNQSAGIVADPITETLMVMLTTPLSVVITEAGVAIFRNQPAMVLPYVNMNSEQLLYIQKTVDTLVNNSVEENMELKGHIQMGGGCIVMVPNQKKYKDFIIDNEALLHAFITSVGKSKQYDTWTKRALSSIIIQRLSCTVNIPKEVILSATTHSENLFRLL
jgi:hypothetical protein